MSLVLVQLAKMTLIVLGIFFTPAITRKFILQLTAPEASKMMKSAGAVMGGATLLGMKGLGMASLVGRSAGLSVARREIPSASHALTQITRRVGATDFGKNSRFFQFSRNQIEKGNEKIQEWHLRNLHQKQKAPKGAPSAPSQEESPGARQGDEIVRFREAHREKKDPISGQFIYPAAPKVSVLSGSIRMADRFVSGAAQKSMNVSRRIRQSSSPSSLEIPKKSTDRTQVKPSRSPALMRGRVDDGGNRRSLEVQQVSIAPVSPHVKKPEFSDRVRNAMAQNRKRIQEIFKGDRL